MKAFYHLNVGLLCGRCGSQMSPDAERNIKHDSKEGPLELRYYCTMSDCPQYKMIVACKPIEVETSEEVI